MVDQFYDCSFDEIKTCILYGDEKLKKELLKDPIIKMKIIDSPNKYDFIHLAQLSETDIMSLLLDDTGILILKQTPYLIDKLNGILTSGNSYVDTLFLQNEFNEIILDNIEKLTYYFSSLSEKSVNSFIHYLLENKVSNSTIKEFLFSVNEQAQVNAFMNFSFPIEIVQSALIRSRKKACEYILQHDLRMTSINFLNNNQLFSFFKKRIAIPHLLLEEKSFLKRLTEMEDVQSYRFLLKELEKENDTSSIEKERKAYYEQEIASFNKDENMLKRYSDCYHDILAHLTDPDLNLEKVLKSHLHFEKDCKEIYYYQERLFQWIQEKNEEEIRSFFIEESHLQLSNMIIDYHFEDIYYNVLLDLKQLVRFQKTEGRTLDDETLRIYDQILSLDQLSYQEKVSLHEQLKEEKQSEKFYDVFREAKDKAYEMIGDCILTKETLPAYQDISLTEKTGVNIYTLTGEPFFAFVKSLAVSKHYAPLSQTNLESFVDGASYSLDGYNKLDTYRDPKEYYNILYDNIPLNQIVHLYPVDSFSRYDRESEEAETTRVFELLTPFELTEKSDSYNEIIVAQKNKRKQDELNENLALPRPIAIYCYDTVSENDIESAKDLGLDIVIVQTNCYPLARDERSLSLQDTIFTSDDYKQEVSYLSNFNQDWRSRRK